MRHSALFIIAIGFGVLASTAWAADINGDWAAEIPDPGGGIRKVLFEFKVENRNLTGLVMSTYGTDPILKGSVGGDKISFETKVDLMGRSITYVYNGKIVGDTIQFQLSGWTVLGSKRGAIGDKTKFIATRSKE